MFRSIQAMRAIAASMVVLIHILLVAKIIGPSIDGNFLSAGVDIFFVISGFVMVAATRNKKIGFSKFMLARFERIVPLYWLMLLVFLILLLISGHADVPPFREIVQAFAFIPYTNSHGEMTPYLTPGWTLSYEIYFYLLFGATLFLPWKRQLLVLAAFFSVAVLLRGVIGSSNALTFRLTSPLPFEFLAGSILAHIMIGRNIKIPVGLALLSTGLVMAVILARYNLPRTICFGAPAVFLVSGAVALEPFFKLWAFSPLLLIGDASYSLYLSHPITLFLLRRTPFEFSPWTGVPVALALCVLVGILCYRLVERPILQWVRLAPPLRSFQLAKSDGSGRDS